MKDEVIQSLCSKTEQLFQQNAKYFHHFVRKKEEENKDNKQMGTISSCLNTESF